MQDFTPGLQATTTAGEPSDPAVRDQLETTFQRDDAQRASADEPMTDALQEQAMNALAMLMSDVNRQLSELEALLDDVSPEERADLMLQISDLQMAQGALTTAQTNPTAANIDTAVSLTSNALLNEGLDEIEDAHQNDDREEEVQDMIYNPPELYAEQTTGHELSTLSPDVQMAYRQEVAALDGVDETNIDDVMRFGLSEHESATLLERAVERVSDMSMPEEPTPEEAMPTSEPNMLEEIFSNPDTKSTQVPFERPETKTTEENEHQGMVAELKQEVLF